VEWNDKYDKKLKQGSYKAFLQQSGDKGEGRRPSFSIFDKTPSAVFYFLFCNKEKKLSYRR